MNPSNLSNPNSIFRRRRHLLVLILHPRGIASTATRYHPPRPWLHHQSRIAATPSHSRTRRLDTNLVGLRDGHREKEECANEPDPYTRGHAGHDPSLLSVSAFESVTPLSRHRVGPNMALLAIIKAQLSFHGHHYFPPVVTWESKQFFHLNDMDGCWIISEFFISFIFEGKKSVYTITSLVYTNWYRLSHKIESRFVKL
jgi:hypothetical protein